MRYVRMTDTFAVQLHVYEYGRYLGWTYPKSPAGVPAGEWNSPAGECREVPDFVQRRILGCTFRVL